MSEDKHSEKMDGTHISLSPEQQEKLKRFFRQVYAECTTLIPYLSHPYVDGVEDLRHRSAELEKEILSPDHFGS